MWVNPTAVPYVTSPFNPARRHPVTGTVQPHWGTDYRAPLGTPLRAAHAGVVVRSHAADPVAGEYVRIDVGGGTWVGYSHLSRRLVAAGTPVQAGQVIGYAGSTGSSTAAHLHFEVSVNGTKVDPVPFLAARVGAGEVSNPGPSLPTVPTVPTPPPLVPIHPEGTPMNTQLIHHPGSSTYAAIGPLGSGIRYVFPNMDQVGVGIDLYGAPVIFESRADFDLAFAYPMVGRS